MEVSLLGPKALLLDETCAACLAPWALLLAAASDSVLVAFESVVFVSESGDGPAACSLQSDEEPAEGEASEMQTRLSS